LQIPQFILEHCSSAGKACRIICTQPRRISAVSVSERVAAERDEKIGQSVGYQIRLESRYVLHYCTLFCYSEAGTLVETCDLMSVKSTSLLGCDVI